VKLLIVILIVPALFQINGIIIAGMKNMKKPFLSFVIMLLSFAATAQLHDKSELHISYGYATREMVMNGFGAIPYKNYSADNDGFLKSSVAQSTFDASKQQVRYGDKKRTGALFATYRFQIIKQLSVGLAVGYEREWSELTYSDYQLKKEVKAGDYSRAAVTIAPELQVLYKQMPMVSVYGGLGMGATLVTEKINGNIGTQTYKGDYFAFQLTPIGVRVGRKLSGFTELGYGYKGAISMGLAYRF